MPPSDASNPKPLDVAADAADGMSVDVENRVGEGGGQANCTAPAEVQLATGSKGPERPAPVSPAQRKLAGKLGQRSLPAQVVGLALWPFLEQLLNFLVGFVDMALAGRLSGKVTVLAAIDALAIAAFVGWFSGLMFGSVGTGATALISRAIGARHKRLANAGIGQAMFLALVVGVFGLLLMLVLGSPIANGFIHAKDGQEQVADLARDFCKQYLWIYGFGLPAAAVLFIGGAALRGAGDTRSPFLAMCIVNVVNVICSLYLALSPEGLAKLHLPFAALGRDLQVAGIAWGTTIAWWLGSMLILGLLVSGKTPLRLRWIRLKPHWHTLKRIIKIGLPSMGESGGVWLINAGIIQIVGLLPAAGALGAHMIAVRVEAISFLPGFAIGIAASTLAGQYLGLGDPARAKRAVELCAMLAVGMMSLMGVVFFFFPEQLVALVSPDSPEHMQLTPPLLMICGVIQPFFAMNMVFGQALRGTGDTKAAMAISYSSMLTVRLLGAFLLGIVFHYGLNGVWFALCTCLTVRGLLFAARFYQGRWQHIEV